MRAAVTPVPGPVRVEPALPQLTGVRVPVLNRRAAQHPAAGGAGSDVHEITRGGAA